MNLQTAIEGDVVLVTPDFETLDADNAKEFRERFAEVTGDHRKVALDLTALRFIDSSGLGAILSCLRELNQHGGDLRLFNMSRPVRSMFELVRMHRVVEIYNTREDVLNSYNESQAA